MPRVVSPTRPRSRNRAETTRASTPADPPNGDSRQSDTQYHDVLHRSVGPPGNSDGAQNWPDLVYVLAIENLDGDVPQLPEFLRGLGRQRLRSCVAEKTGEQCSCQGFSHTAALSFDDIAPRWSDQVTWNRVGTAPLEPGERGASRPLTPSQRILSHRVAVSSNAVAMWGRQRSASFENSLRQIVQARGIELTAGRRHVSLHC